MYVVNSEETDANATDETPPQTQNDLFKPENIMSRHIKDAEKAGETIASDSDIGGRRVVRFSNGGQMVGHKSGFIVHSYVNGNIVQYSPNGTHLTVSVNVSD